MNPLISSLFSPSAPRNQNAKLKAGEKREAEGDGCDQEIFHVSISIRGSLAEMLSKGRCSINQRHVAALPFAISALSAPSAKNQRKDEIDRWWLWRWRVVDRRRRIDIFGRAVTIWAVGRTSVLMLDVTPAIMVGSCGCHRGQAANECDEHTRQRGRTPLSMAYPRSPHCTFHNCFSIVR